MTRIRRFFILAVVAVVLLGAGGIAIAKDQTLGEKRVWYAKRLINNFSKGIEIRGAKYDTADLRCLAKDITVFKVAARRVMDGGKPSFEVRGAVALKKVPPGSSLVDKDFRISLVAFIYSADGKIIWRGEGSPRNDRITGAGGMRAFNITNEHLGQKKGDKILIMAVAMPVRLKQNVRPIVLGVKQQKIGGPKKFKKRGRR